MYEQFGLEGLAAFKETVDYAKAKGLVVIGDVKRGDIGSTSEAYAVAHLGGVEIEGKKFYGFDEDFATAIGTHSQIYNLIIAIIIAVIIVVAMKLVGSLLISALIIFPALSAMKLFKSFRSVIISSAIISTVCALLGIFISLIGTPVGSTIVAVNILVFIFSTIFSLFRKI